MVVDDYINLLPFAVQREVRDFPFYAAVSAVIQPACARQWCGSLSLLPRCSCDRRANTPPSEWYRTCMEMSICIPYTIPGHCQGRSYIIDSDRSKQYGTFKPHCYAARCWSVQALVDRESRRLLAPAD